MRTGSDFSASPGKMSPNRLSISKERSLDGFEFATAGGALAGVAVLLLSASPRFIKAACSAGFRDKVLEAGGVVLAGGTLFPGTFAAGGSTFAGRSKLGFTVAADGDGSSSCLETSPDCVVLHLQPFSLSVVQLV